MITLPAALRPAQQARANTERGVASWFGAPAHTCAHRTLPFGTVIKVTMISTGVSTECSVADRGPSDMSRVIDLSTDTFEHLADTSVGLIEVVIEW
ncbi:MAG TPA: septal ring lytic transglycosylase RlpA family protein [Acidimicrobiales bacterium]